MNQKFDSQQDFYVEDEFPLAPGEDRTFKTETYNHWAYDPIQDIGLNIWFGSGQGADDRGVSNFVSTVSIFYKGELFTARSTGDGNPADGVAGGNVFLTFEEPFKRLRIDFVGLVRSGAGEGRTAPGLVSTGPARRELARMRFTLDLVTPPIEQGSQGDRGEVAASGTTARTAIRYEQLCHIRGELEIGARKATVDALGMRSHRRNSTSIYASGAVGHSWAAGLFPSGKGIHISNYRIEPDAAIGSLYGHYFDGKRYHEGEVLRFPYYTGAAESERARLEMLVKGRVVAIDMVIMPALLGKFPPEVRLSQSVVRFEADGEVGGGLLERSLTVIYPAGGEYVAPHH